MTKARSGSLVFYGTKDDTNGKMSQKLADALPTVLKVERREGLPHDFVDMNKEGDFTSSETIDYLVGLVEAQLA